ncbi:MAG: hypothetical protein K2M57_00795 [Paramuribaculum sp.]|nr:hypothetical protein [Paramuribaculum sp.]
MACDIHKTVKITVRPIYQIIDLYAPSSDLDSFTSELCTGTDKPAGLTQLIIRRCEPGKSSLSGCHVTVSASSDGIRVVIGEGFVLLPGVETKYTLFVTRQGLISALYGHVRISVDIFTLTHLNGATAAIPTVRRVKLLPEQ